jgi:hypothetical protein
LDLKKDSHVIIDDWDLSNYRSKVKDHDEKGGILFKIIVQLMTGKVINA